MGAIISRFRKKPSTKEVLEKLQTQVDALESSKRDTMAWHKKLIGYLLLYFSLLYLLAAVVAYFRFFHHPDWQGFTSQAILWVPFLVAPFVFLVVRRVLTWWYHRKVRKDEAKLKDLQKQRKKILDEVMETETYKVAKEILEKFAPEQLMSRTAAQSSVRSPPAPQPGLQRPGPTSPMMGGGGGGGSGVMELRRRVPAGPGASPVLSGVGRGRGGATLGTPAAPPGGSLVGRTPQLPTSSMATAGGPKGTAGVAAASASAQKPFGVAQGGTRLMPALAKERGVPGPPLPRPVLPRERGYMDRMVEYLVGDGPSNRYALICKQCQSHNGMALKEEFEYVAYRCCYCYYWNPARKQRPVAPKLMASPTGGRRRRSEDSSSESSEGETKVLPKTPEKNPSEAAATLKPAEQVRSEEGETKPQQEAAGGVKGEEEVKSHTVDDEDEEESEEVGDGQASAREEKEEEGEEETESNGGEGEEEEERIESGDEEEEVEEHESAVRKVDSGEAKAGPDEQEKRMEAETEVDRRE